MVELEIHAEVNIILTAIKQICQKFNWSIKEESELKILFQTPASLLSWGETVAVEIKSNQGDSSVLVSITSSANAQLIDWGKNNENVQKLVTDLKVKFR